MAPNFHLIINNILMVISVIALISMALFTFLNGYRKTTNVVFSLIILAVATFLISHTIGINITNPDISKIVLMFNLSIFFIGAFSLHLTFALINKEREKRGIIVFIYASAVAFTIIFTIFPDLFLLPSIPKMYFPNYYNPGTANWVRLAFLYGICVPYMIYLMSSAYLQAKSILEKNRHKYFIMAIIIGYSIGFFPNFLVYNIQIDPIWGMVTGVFVIPLIYGSLRYGLFDVQVIAKQAFLHSVAVGIVGGLIILLNYSNNLIEQAYPEFPGWIMALVSSVLAVTMGVIIWRRLRENDLLKYEFITTITHKFRTPLTHIKWSSDNLLKSNLGESEREQIGDIKTAGLKLIELTNLLVKLPEVESGVYDYHFRPGNFSNIVQEIVESLTSAAEIKNINIVKNITPEIMATFDIDHIKFAVQVFIENAIHYTLNDGLITVSVYREGKNVVYAVKDSGIGLSQENLSLLFSKFYRGSKARTADTEGVGIGLYVAKEIITRHRGKIWAESAGLNKGSIFFFSLPAVD